MYTCHIETNNSPKDLKQEVLKWIEDNREFLINNLVSKLEQGLVLELNNKSVNKSETCGLANGSYVYTTDIRLNPERADFIGTKEEFKNFLGLFTLEYIKVMNFEGTEKVEKNGSITTVIEYRNSDLV